MTLWLADPARAKRVQLREQVIFNLRLTATVLVSAPLRIAHQLGLAQPLQRAPAELSQQQARIVIQRGVK